MDYKTVETLTDAQINGLIDFAQKTLKTRDEDRKQKATEEAIALILGAGMTLDDFLKNGKAKKKNTKATYPKGRNWGHPENPNLIWNSNGRMSKWAEEYVAKGGKLVDLGPVKKTEGKKVA